MAEALAPWHHRPTIGPMPKPAPTVFLCSECGGESLRWAGQCPHCRAWNTLQEFRPARAGSERRSTGRAPDSRPVPMTEVSDAAASRDPLRWGEVNRVLGGGIVPGSLVLVGGEPGVGKSTLLTQLAHQIAAGGGSVLYASGEESAQQVRMRADRLDALHSGVLMLAENDLDAVLTAIAETSPRLAIVDSIQTVYDSALDSAAGSVSQVREAAGRLMRAAKETRTPIFLVGHVTKEGAIAGPRVLEHIVDAVLYLEGDRQQEFRILRATKNRFGSTEEIGIFSMGERGLEEVSDPSGILLSGASLETPGTTVTVVVEGSRPLLVEVQTLVAARGEGAPLRRVVNGFDFNRLQMLLAVVESRAERPLGAKDVFVNVTGGFRVTDPAADLALALSVISNLDRTPIGADTLVLGELGLTGEVRRVSLLERRLQEAARRGFKRAIVPAAGQVPAVAGLAVVPVKSLRDAIGVAFAERAAAALADLR